jgi:glycosyltransferase involved in cell wall biosynthesis
MTRIASTMWAPGEECWADVHVIDSREHSELGFYRRVLTEVPGHDAFVVNGAGGFKNRYRDLICVALLRFFRRRPAIVIAEVVWEPGSAALNQLVGRSGLGFERFAQGAVRFLDRLSPTYCVFSTEELDIVPRRWGVPRERVTFTPCSSTLFEGVPPTSDGDYVFAGGNPFRDYPSLIEAARGLPCRVVIGTTTSVPEGPPNVEAGPLPHDRYTELMAGAGIVVVPLVGESSRSAGHQSFLNPMLMGKATIVSDAMGVRDYVEDSVTGWVVPAGDPNALRERILWVRDPANAAEVERVRAAAKEYVETTHMPGDYWCRLREVAEAAAAARGA